MIVLIGFICFMSNAECGTMVVGHGFKTKQECEEFKAILDEKITPHRG
jgi:hypothetical protein